MARRITVKVAAKGARLAQQHEEPQGQAQLPFDEVMRRAVSIPPERARAIIEAAGGSPRKSPPKRVHAARR